jgi:2,4-diketo-3-deoxy-L-fuconate hydrolase
LRVARIQVDGAAPVAAIERDGVLQLLAQDVPALIEGAAPGDTFDAVAGAKRLAPVVPGKVVAIGLNYLDHIRESGLETPQRPLVFAKFPSSVIGSDEPIRLPLDLTQRVDWEVELAVVIGKRARYVDLADAESHVAGYALHNDYSERTFQLERGGQWVKGKSCDTFAPIGPFLATPDEIPDPQSLGMWLTVNGNTRQRGSTTDMVFGVAALVSYVSQFMTLLPGDVISTGTPAGVGLGMKPEPVFLEAGDVVELGIDKLGRSRQQVVTTPERGARPAR